MTDKQHSEKNGGTGGKAVSCVCVVAVAYLGFHKGGFNPPLPPLPPLPRPLPTSHPRPPLPFPPFPSPPLRSRPLKSSWGSGGAL